MSDLYLSVEKLEKLWSPSDRTEWGFLGEMPIYDHETIKFERKARGKYQAHRYCENQNVWYCCCDELFPLSDLQDSPA